MDAGKSTVGQFTVVGALPAGPYGSVWKAHDSSSGRDVVLKQLALATPERQEQVVAQAAKLGNLRHPNIARTYEPVSDASTIWLVEDLVDGASLETISAAGVALTVRQSLGVLHGTIEGLAAAHRQGLVHGSVSARTIMVSTEGTPQLVEFGAWLGEPEVAGVGAFASPEAFAGRSLSATADVYSVGAVLARALLGRGADTWAPTAEPVSLDNVQPDLRPVLARALAADPADRQPNGQVLLDELDKAARRVFGAVWWTTEGVGAAVASAVAASVAATATGAAGAVGAGGLGAVGGSTAAASPAGGFGAVSGSLNLRGDLGAGAMAGAATVAGGAAALAGSTKAAAQEVRKGSRRLIGIIAGAVALVALAIGAFALTRPHGVQAVPPAGVVAQPTTSSPAAAPSPAPSATTKLNPAEGFTGFYRYNSVVTKSTSSSVKVGEKTTSTWVVKTSCAKDRCTTSISSSTKSKQPITPNAGSWTTRLPYTAGCENTKTHVLSGQKVAMLYTRTLQPTQRTAALVTTMVGADRNQQLKPCRGQVIALVDVRRKITVTYVHP